MTINWNVGSLLAGFYAGISQATAADQLLASGIFDMIATDALGDTNYVGTLAAVSDGTFVSRRTVSFTEHTVSNAQVSVTAHALKGSIILSAEELKLANNTIVRALVNNGNSAMETVVGMQLAQVVAKKMVKLGLHTMVTAATSASMSYDITGETSPANQITASTYLDFLGGIDLTYLPEDAPDAKVYIASPSLIGDFKKLRNGVTNEVLLKRGPGGRLLINEVPVLGFHQVDGDDGTITGCKGTYVAADGDTAAKYRLIRAQAGACHIFASTLPEQLASNIMITETATQAAGRQYVIQYSVELAGYVGSVMNMASKPGVAYGLANLVA